MRQDQKAHAFKVDLLLAGAMVVVGLAVSAVSLTRLANADLQMTQMTQATPPLQSTPGAESKPSAPAEPTTTGTRPNAVKPEPARPDDEAQKAGAKPALPPAPAEKTAEPIPQR